MQQLEAESIHILREVAAESPTRLIVHVNQEGLDKGINPFSTSGSTSTSSSRVSP